MRRPNQIPKLRLCHLLSELAQFSFQAVRFDVLRRLAPGLLVQPRGGAVFISESRDQNKIFSPNWICLGEFACELITPKLVLVTVVFGALN
jgi:hypothetical protein